MAPVGLLLTIFLTRQMGPRFFGLYTMALAMVTWAEVIITAFFSRAVIRLAAQSPDRAKVEQTAACLCLVCSLAAVLILWLAAPSLAVGLGEPDLEPCLRLLAWDIPLFNLGSLQRMFLASRQRFLARALARSCFWLGKLVFILPLVGLGWSWPGAVAGGIAASLLAVIVAWPSQPLRPWAGLSLPLGSLRGHPLTLSLQGLAAQTFNYLGLIMLQALGASTVLTGQYAAASKLALLPALIATAIAPLLLAKLSRDHALGEAAAAGIMGRRALRAVVCLAPLVAALIGCAGELTALLLGAAYAPASPLLRLLLVGALCHGFFEVATAVMAAAGRTAATLLASMARLALALPAYYYAIAWDGSHGAALATVVASGLGLASLLPVLGDMDALPSRSTLPRVLLASLAAGGLAWLWPAPGWWVLFKLPACVLAGGLALCLAGEFSATERAGLMAWGRQRWQRP
jgi:O-antigen/teichoic acid export membrane protein